MLFRRLKTLLVLSLLLTLVSQSLLASAIMLCSHASDQPVATTLDHGMMNHAAMNHEAMKHEAMTHKAMDAGTEDYDASPECCDEDQCAVSLCSFSGSIAVGSLRLLPPLTMAQLSVVSAQGFPSSPPSSPFRPPIAG